MSISRRGLLKLAVGGVTAGYASSPPFASAKELKLAQQVAVGTKNPIRLDRNENAYGPPPKPSQRF